MEPQLGKKLNVSRKDLQYLVACGLKVVLCLNGVAATVDMFGAEHKDERALRSLFFMTITADGLKPDHRL
jgi:hypothetical protein